MHFSFFIYFSDFVIFQDVKWMFLIFHDLSWSTLVSPSVVIESLADYSSLGRHLCSLKVCITSIQDLLAFIVSGEKSGLILIGLHLLVT